MAPPELEPPTAVYDACVLYDSVQRDLLLQLHVEGAVRARWSRRILEEYLEHLTANRPDLGARVHHAPRAMAEAFPGSIIQSYEAFLGRVMLPDPKDDHVVAVALAARASVNVTANIRDFPAAVLAPHDIRTQKPDDFVVTLAGGDIAQDRRAWTASTKGIRKGLSAPDAAPKCWLTSEVVAGLNTNA